MDYQDFDTNEFKKMSRSEQRKTIKTMLDNLKKQPNAGAAFFDVSANKIVDVFDLIDEHGEDSVINFMIDAILASDENIMLSKITSKELHDMAAKDCTSDTLTEEEKTKMAFAKTFLENKQQLEATKMSFHKIGTDLLISLLRVTQQDIYNPTLDDLQTLTSSIIMSSLIENENLTTHKYVGDMFGFVNMSKSVGDDILANWENYMGENKLPIETQIAGFLSALYTLLMRSRIECCDMSNYVSEEEDFEQDELNAINKTVGLSNDKPKKTKSSSSTNEKMRKRLKED